MACERIAHAEFGDKTFCLLIILTMLWCSWHKDDHNNETESIHKDDPSKNPARLILASTIGTIFVNIKSILWQENIWANEVRLFVAIILVVTLLNYMFSVCSQTLNKQVALDEIQKEREALNKLSLEDKEKILERWRSIEERKKTIRKSQKELVLKDREFLHETTLKGKVGVNEAEEMWKKLANITEDDINQIKDETNTSKSKI